MKSYLENAVAVDVFCGIGGLSYGMKKAGIHVAAGIDLDETCKFAYEENVRGTFHAKDISEVTGNFLKTNYWKDKATTKILVGCAPCQPFSTHSNKYENRHHSKKWRLLNEFKRLIDESNPDIISMENVTNLSNQPIFKNFVSFLENEKNYHVSFSNVYCPDYGIPQKRRRLVLLGSKLGPIKLIEKTHSPENYVSVREAISGLPRVNAGQPCDSDPLHRTCSLSPTNLERIKSSKPNGTWLDWPKNLRLPCHNKASGSSYKSVYGRMSWDEPSPTITTQFYNYGTGRFGHPTQNRALTIREAAILQSFPENYKFAKTDDEILITKLGVHIGNAVPVDLGYAVGKSIQKHLALHRGKT